MIKRFLGSEQGTAFVSRCASGIIRFILSTSRLKFDPPDAYEKLYRLHPQTVAIWHGQFMLMPVLKPPSEAAKVKAMVSRHGDAALLGSVLDRFGTELIRGAGAGKRKRDRGGASAMRATLRAIAEENVTVVMTADVPPGPARRAGIGITTIGAKSGRAVVPVAVASSRYLKLPTWSAFTINLPFSTIYYVVGDPVYVPNSDNADEIEAGRLAIQDALNKTTARAYALVGAADPLSMEEMAKPGLTLKAYRLATKLAAPIAPLLLSWRTRKGKEEPDRHPERYGRASIPRPPGFLAWFHAASVGEVNAALPVMNEIIVTRPDVQILLTTGTVTSARLARARLPEGAMHQYVPLDRRSYMNRFLDHWRPDLAVLVESEIWPNLVLETKAREIPLLLINARMSNSTFKSWRRRPGFSRPIFSAFDLILAQNDVLAERFAQIGAQNAKSVGNLKADAPPPPVDAAAKAELAKSLGGRPLWLAASTHPGEEEVICSAHLQIKKHLPDIVTIIAPRHPDRGGTICETLRAQGLRIASRSAGEPIEADTDIYVADTIGELGLFYALAPTAFIGGSLVEHGGQNPVEAVKLGTAVLTGPHVQNFRDAFSALIDSGGAREVEDADTLASAVLALLQDENACALMRANAESTITSMGGALPATLEAIAPYLPQEARLQHAS